MKIKDVVNEGLIDDLRAIGQASQAAGMASMKSKMSGVKSKLTPQFWKDWSQSVASARNEQQVGALADSFVKTWEQVIARQYAGRTDPVDVAEYRQLLSNWLARTTGVRISAETMDAMEKIITQTQPQLVKQFLKTSFIPSYLEARNNPIYSIPDGYKVELLTKDEDTGEEVRTTYEWDTPTAGWRDLSTGGILTGGGTHILATKKAMAKIQSQKGAGAAGATGGTP